MSVISRTMLTKKTLIIGAGTGGRRVIEEAREKMGKEISILGILDDDALKKGNEILGIPVLGTTEEIARIAGETGAKQAIIAIPSATGKEISRIIGLCEDAGVEYRIVPGIYDFLTGRAVVASPIREVRAEDLIKRKPAKIDVDEVKSFISGKRILITGGAGSIGSEIVKSLHELGPEKIFVMDVNENTMMELLWELRDGKKLKKDRVVPIIADIRDPVRMNEMFKMLRPQIIYHAAARKHVPFMELFPEEAIETNVMGTYNLLRMSEIHGVENFVLISTDKAVNPVNVMGATKRMAELLVKEFSLGGKFKAMSVRFGNVLGSAGSAIPLFKKQIEQGGPVTVTDPEIKRFFMTIPEAASLVVQSSAFGSGGDTYVLEMGEQIKILDMVEQMIRIAGFEPYEDIEIRFTGLRPGEKMYEELYYEYESKKATKNPGIFGVSSEKRWRTYPEDIEEFGEYVAGLQRERIISRIREIVPEFIPERTSFDEKIGGIV